MTEEGRLIQKHIMKKIIGLFAIGISVLVSMPARGALATWNFNSGSLPTVSASSTVSGITSANLTTTGGSASSSIASSALVYSYASSSSAQLNGTIITLTIVNPSGGLTYSGFSATADVTYSKFLDTVSGTWSYKIGNQTPISGPTSLIGQGIGVALGSMPSITLGAGQTLTLYYTLSGATDHGNSTGSLTFDNLNIITASSVPEPINYAVTIFGLIFFGGGVGRFYIGKTRLTA